MLSPFRYMMEVIHDVFSNCRKTKRVQSDCRRDYSQGIDLCLNEGDEVVDCDLIIV